MACNPDPQSRLTVWPATSMGNPASSSAMRATLRLSSPDWLAQPKMTSSMLVGSIRARCMVSAITSAARSSGRTSLRLPPYRPIGVRTAERITASSITLPSLKLCLTFLDKRLHPFTHIFGREQQEEDFALDLKALLQRRLEGRQHRLFSETQCDWRTLRDQFCQFERLREVFALWHNMIDQTLSRHLLRGERYTRQHHFHSAVLAECTRQPLRATCAGDNAEIDFWLPEACIL